ncbi:MAG: hypothetical protein JST42_03885 [Bacteroidetes bacterium]|nr:hypothetical protein [Bacteroidota bacterium]
MNKYLIFVSFAFSLHACSSAQDAKTMYIYIPINYTGWVNIIFNDSASSFEPLIFDNGYVYFITKDPQDYRVRTDIHPDGFYKTTYFYYSTDTTIKLSSQDYPKNNILFERILGSRDYKRVHPSAILAYSFYVSKEPLDDSKLSVDELPGNKILH